MFLVVTSCHFCLHLASLDTVPCASLTWLQLCAQDTEAYHTPSLGHTASYEPSTISNQVLSMETDMYSSTDYYSSDTGIPANAPGGFNTIRVPALVCKTHLQYRDPLGKQACSFDHPRWFAGDFLSIHRKRLH